MILSQAYWYPANLTDKLLSLKHCRCVGIHITSSILEVCGGHQRENVIPVSCLCSHFTVIELIEEMVTSESVLPAVAVPVCSNCQFIIVSCGPAFFSLRNLLLNLHHEERWLYLGSINEILVSLLLLVLLLYIHWSSVQVLEILSFCFSPCHITEGIWNSKSFSKLVSVLIVFWLFVLWLSPNIYSN